MPRTLKRRSEVLDEEADASSSSSSPLPPQQPPRRRQRSESSSSSHSSPDPQAPSGQSSTLQILIKKLVRLALSTEYSRTPLRRTDISTKILSDAGASRQFAFIFAGAQAILRSTFGMQMAELPSREKTSLKDRRAQAQNTQAKNAASSSSKSWILVSVLPKAYKTNPAILPPSSSAESTYTALYTMTISLILLNGGTLPENRLLRYLKRMNADEHTPLEVSTERLLQRMVREGYVERRKDTGSGEEVVEWIVGPRGKVEVGVEGVRGLVKGVYGVGQNRDAEEGDEDIEEEELDAKLARSLGVKDVRVNGNEEGDTVMVNGNGGGQDEAEPQTQAQTQRRIVRPRRVARNDDSDEDDD